MNHPVDPMVAPDALRYVMPSPSGHAILFEGDSDFTWAWWHYPSNDMAITALLVWANDEFKGEPPSGWTIAFPPNYRWRPGGIAEKEYISRTQANV